MATLNKNPYVKTDWHDHIIDVISGSVIQEGTRFTASRANNIEDGIFNAYQWLVWYANEFEKMRVQLEIFSRAPINNGTFYATLDGGDGKAMSLDKDKAVAQLAYNAGTTVIKLDKVPFAVGEYVTICDDEKTESVRITAINDKNITVTALAQNHKKGALVARSTVAIDTTNKKMNAGNWSTFSVELVEVV